MRLQITDRIGLAFGALALTAMAATAATACGANTERGPASPSTPSPTVKGSVLTPAPELPTTTEPRG